MKVSRSNLRRIIKEVLDAKLPTKLRVLDFDDTIAHTGERVKLYTPQGHRMLSSDDYATYVPGPGEYYDESSFDEFSQVNVDLASPVKPVFRIFMNFVNAQEGNRIILILTARQQVVEPYVRKFLKQYQNSRYIILAP